MQTPEDNDKSVRTPENVITKCFLDSPDRVFVDITNTVLMGNQRTYTLKNSSLNTVKISQFSTNPHTVRIVFEYNKKFDPKDFAIYANDRQIIIRYSKSLLASEKFKTIYNNMTQGERKADLLEGVTYSSETKEKIINVADTKEPDFKTIKTEEAHGFLCFLFGRAALSVSRRARAFLCFASGLRSSWRRPTRAR